MKLPNYQNAVVEETKITKYLLSDVHTSGKGKAQFFTHFGFSIEQWENLANALLQHAKEHEITNHIDSPHGVKYVIEGRLNSPDKRNPFVRAIWITDLGNDYARLVTAYPLGE
jgi:hypothetical protein